MHEYNNTLIGITGSLMHFRSSLSWPVTCIVQLVRQLVP